MVAQLVYGPITTWCFHLKVRRGYLTHGALGRLQDHVQALGELLAGQPFSLVERHPYKLGNAFGIPPVYRAVSRHNRRHTRDAESFEIPQGLRLFFGIDSVKLYVPGRKQLFRFQTRASTLAVI